MPSHMGSYDGKGDPDNYLHLFEGLHEEQRIFGFVHWLRTRSLVKFLYTDLPTTYKGLMEKNYTWIKAREVKTNGASNDHREGSDRFKKNSSWDTVKGRETEINSPHTMRSIMDHGHNTNDCRELRHQIEEAVKSRQLSHLVKGIKKGKAKDSEIQQGDWNKGSRDVAPVKASILMINRKDHISKRKSEEEPLVGLEKSHSHLSQVGEGSKRLREASPEVTKGVLSYTGAEEKIIVNNKYPEQMVIIGKQLPTSFKKSYETF
ncbi:hypothetical protein Tco_1457823 [Tanacetum coccineum]